MLLKIRKDQSSHKSTCRETVSFRINNPATSFETAAFKLRDIFMVNEVAIKYPDEDIC